MAINPQLTNFTLAADEIKGRKYAPEKQGERQKNFVTLQKSVNLKQVKHHSFEHLIFNSMGDIIKLSTSC